MARKKRSEAHAALRLTQRYGNNEVTMERLHKLVQKGEFQYVKRQTGTRSLCKTVVGSEDVYFILARPGNSIVTVLTPEQAKEQLY